MKLHENKDLFADAIEAAARPQMRAEQQSLENLRRFSAGSM